MNTGANIRKNFDICTLYSVFLHQPPHFEGFQSLNVPEIEPLCSKPVEEEVEGCVSHWHAPGITNHAVIWVSDSAIIIDTSQDRVVTVPHCPVVVDVAQNGVVGVPYSTTVKLCQKMIVGVPYVAVTADSSYKAVIAISDLAIWINRSQSRVVGITDGLCVADISYAQHQEYD